MRFIRILAFIGPLVVIIVEAFSDFPLKPRQEDGIVVLILVFITVPLCMQFLMPAAWRLLRRNLDMLIPLGLLVFAEGVLAWIVAIPAFAAVMLPGYLPGRKHYHDHECHECEWILDRGIREQLSVVWKTLRSAAGQPGIQLINNFGATFRCAGDRRQAAYRGYDGAMQATIR